MSILRTPNQATRIASVTVDKILGGIFYSNGTSISVMITVINVWWRCRKAGGGYCKGGIRGKKGCFFFVTS